MEISDYRVDGNDHLYHVCTDGLSRTVMFRDDSVRIEDRYILARELHRRYGASAKQIARVTGLDAHILKSMLCPV